MASLPQNGEASTCVVQVEQCDSISLQECSNLLLSCTFCAGNCLSSLCCEVGSEVCLFAVHTTSLCGSLQKFYWNGGRFGWTAPPEPMFLSHMTCWDLHSGKLTQERREHRVPGRALFSFLQELKASISILCFELLLKGVFSESLVGR